MTQAMEMLPRKLEIADMSATGLSSAIKSQEVSCREVMQAFLDRIDRFNPTVNAIVALGDSASLLSEADAMDARLSRGEWLGPLHGMPQAPKDILPAAGMVTTRGSPLFRDAVSPSDAIVFERMRKSGSIFIGRTNTPEFGLGGHTYNAVYGVTGNSLDPRLSAGGSSGGTAAAVALGMLPIADGSDMMGSLRTPAAFNNVWGLRTTPGCVPYGPGDEVFLQQFTVAGPMARNPQDLALLLSVQAGYDARVPTSYKQPAFDHVSGLERSFKRCRVGWLGDMQGFLPMEPGVMAIAESALRSLEAIGCLVEEAAVDFDLQSLWRAWLDLRSFSVSGFGGALYSDSRKKPLLKPEAVWEIERGLALKSSEFFQASCVRTAWYQAINRLLKQYEFLVLPSAQVFPFDADIHWPQSINGHQMTTYHEWLKVAIPATMAGLPALAAPAGFNEAGLPAGIQIIGRQQADWSLLQLGCAYEQASGQSLRRSPLLDC
ncbi:amidase [Ottowia thiooxydans]|uniref:amidase n=1 Tax=Ottowia thiooxydans TaxID=219182 RepID=UPI0012EBA35B|nr:amidase [Ottowia thiooxydans]